MLSEAISKGYVERVPVSNSFHFWRGEWYRDKETGEIYRLQAPDFAEKIGGYWGSVAPDDFAKDDQSVQ